MNRSSLRVLVATLLFAVVIVVVPASRATAATPLFGETFTTATAPDFVLPTAPDATNEVNSACLTAGTDPSQAPVPGCNLSPPDASGSGALQFTSLAQYSEGGAFYDSSIPTSQGLDIAFDSYQYAPSGTDPADGIGFVIAAADPSDPLPVAALGGVGGSLGYSPYQLQSSGLTDGYLGVGLDEYGNYSNPQYDGTGCTDPSWAAFASNQVTVRGPGDGDTGYCPISSTLSTDGGAGVDLTGTTRADSLVAVEVALNPGATAAAMVDNPSVTVAPGSYTVAITDISGTLRTLTGALPSTVNGGIPTGTIPSDWINPATGIPYQLTFGWTASTGLFDAYHEINELTANSLGAAPVLFNVTSTDSAGGQLQSGATTTWDIAAGTQNTSATENDPISMVDTFSGPADLSGASGQGWTCSIATLDEEVSTNTVTCSYPAASSTPVPPGTALPDITITGTTTAPAGTEIASTAQVSSQDGLPAEATDPAVVASPAGLSIVTTATTTSGIGGTISDTAVLSGGDNPTGTLTFDAFGPNDDSGCDTTPAFTSSTFVNGDGSYASDPFTPTAMGVYQWQAFYGGDDDNATASTACGDVGETSTVIATPTITTTASPAVTLGGSISDTADLSGGAGDDGPTGDITFSVYGPDDPTCDAMPVFTSTSSVTGNGTYSSDTFAPTAAGTYQFTAGYSGDANNIAVTTACGDPDESVVVSPAAPSLTTQASAPVPVGRSVSDTATLAGGAGPTGTVTFQLFGPGTGCDTDAAFTSTVTVAGNGTYPSASFTPGSPGVYQWTASYSGDADNASTSEGCDAAGESTTVLVLPTLTTTASAPVGLGGAIADTATLAGGDKPTGTITFQVYGPGSNGCDTEAAFSSNATVDGNGAYVSQPFTPTRPGSYQFVATYSGDPDNSRVVTSCGDPNETVVVATIPTTTTSTTSTVPTTSTTSTSTSTSTLPATTTSTSTTSTSTPSTSTTRPPTTTTTAPPPTTTTTTTTTAPRSTTTTAPRSTTTTAPRTTTTTAPRAAPTTTATTTPATTTTSSAPTTSTTTPTTSSTTPSPAPAITLGAALKLNQISTPPGGPAVATGRGCVPNSPVTLFVGSKAIGNTVASAQGSFTANLLLNVPVGHYTITAHCGVTLSAGIDVVLSSQASPPSSTTAVLLVLFLLIVLLATSQLSTH